MENHLEVEFRLFGRGFDPKALSRDLGKECTLYQLGDDKTLAFWILSKTAAGDIDIEALCRELVSELRPLQEKLIQLIERLGLRADFCLRLGERPRTEIEFMEGEYPVKNFRIEPAEMQFLTAVRATLFIETACVFFEHEGASRTSR